MHVIMIVTYLIHKRVPRILECRSKWNCWFRLCRCHHSCTVDQNTRLYLGKRRTISEIISILLNWKWMLKPVCLKVAKYNVFSSNHAVYFGLILHLKHFDLIITYFPNKWGPCIPEDRSKWNCWFRLCSCHHFCKVDHYTRLYLCKLKK